MKPRGALALLLLLCMSGQAAAQAVYRCGADGRSYSDQPCAEGRAVDVGDARTPEQRSQSTQAARRDARAADELQRERQRREPLAQPAASLGRGPAAALAPAAAASQPAVKPGPRTNKSRGKRKDAEGRAGTATKKAR